MKKAKFLTVLGVMLAMSVTGCNGGEKTSESAKPSASNTPSASQSASNNPSASTSNVDPQPQVHIHNLEGAEKVDVIEAEGAVVEDMYKCKDCDKYAIAWSALDYDVAKTTERSTKKPESRASGQAIRFDSTANYQDGKTDKKGCHIVYNINVPEDATNVNIMFKTSARTDTNELFNKYEDDQAKGYEYIPQASGDPVLDRPATRYGIKVDGNVFIVPEDKTGQQWQDGVAWYQFPLVLESLTAGAHEFEIYNLGGFRVEMYEFALVGFGPHEHVDNYKVSEAKYNGDNKPVMLGTDSFTGKKAAIVELKNISGAYASTKTNAEGEPEAFALGEQDTGFTPKDSYKLDKGKVIAFKVNLSAAVTGAKIEIGAEFDNAERYFYNMAIKGNETMSEQYADKTSEDAWRYYVKVNDGDFQPMNTEKKMQEVIDKTAGKYMPLGTFDLQEGANMIYIRQGNIGYRVTFDNPLRVVFSGDATITGDHAHMFTEFVSETVATCTGAGSKVMKCSCGETDTVATPALGHDFQVGEADANGISAITCKRDGCNCSGIQFDGYTGDNASAIDADNKVTKKFNFKWNVNMPKAGKVALYMNFAYSAGNGGQKFGTGYAIKIGETTGTITIGDVAFNTLIKQAPECTFVEIGTIDVALGANVIDYTHGNQGTRLISDKLVRLIYVD